MCKKCMAILLSISILATSGCFVAANYEPPVSGGKDVLNNLLYSRRDVVNENFNTYTGSEVPAGWTASAGYVKSTESAVEYGNSLTLSADSTKKDTEIYQNLSTGKYTGGIQLITAEFKFSDNKHNRPLLITQQNLDAGKSLEKVENLLIKAGNNGYIQTWGGENLMPYEPGLWYKIDIILDTIGQTSEVYINNKNVIKKTTFPKIYKYTNKLTVAKQWNGDGSSPAVTVDNIGLFELKKDIENYSTYYTKSKIATASDDFNSYENIDGVTASKWTSKSAIIEPDSRGGKLVKLTGNCELYKNISSSDIDCSELLIEQDVKFAELAQGRYLMIPTQNASSEESLPKVENLVLQTVRDKFKLKDTANTELAPIVAGDWYTVAMYVNFKTQSYELYIDGKCVLENTKFPSTQGEMKHINRFDTVKQWNAAGGDIFVDNVNFYSLEKNPTPSGWNNEIMDNLKVDYNFTKVLEENFEGWPNNKNLNIDTKNGDVKTTDRQNSFALKYDNVAAYEVGYNKSLQGKILMKASYKFNDNNISRKIIMSTVKNGSPKVENFYLGAHNNGEFKPEAGFSGTSLGKYVAGKWYEVLIILNLDEVNKTYDMYINGEVLKSKIPLVNPVDGIDKINFLQHWKAAPQAGTDPETYIDDIGVYQLNKSSEPSEISVISYGEKVNAMSQLKGGDIISLESDRNSDGKFGVIALYNSDNKLININTNRKVTLPKNIDNCTIKAYLWEDLEGVNPVCDSKTIK